jgi:hypothetical protein
MRHRFAALESISLLPLPPYPLPNITIPASEQGGDAAQKQQEQEEKMKCE